MQQFFIFQLWVGVDLVWYSCQVCNEICESLEVDLFKIPYNSSGNSESHSANNGHSSPQSSSSGPVTRGRKKHSRN